MAGNDRPAPSGEGELQEEVEVTPEMVSAGASVLWELEGEVSKEALAREVFRAMARCRPHLDGSRSSQGDGEAS